MIEPSLRAASRSSMFLRCLAAGAALVAAPSCGSTVTYECGANLDSDPDNCGACGNACPEDMLCSDGTCVGKAVCIPSLTDCNSSCVDLTSDPEHCGSCNAACPVGLFCLGGVCQAGCPPGLASCGGLCVDLLNDPQNCGGCGLACPPGTSCADGVCGAFCPPGFVDCGGFCADITIDPQNCGGCGVACSPGAACVGGQCSVPCPPGLVDCGGACVDLLSDPDHCGGCFLPCAPGAACDGGLCGCPGGACGLCSTYDLGSVVPQLVAGNTLNAPDSHAPSCASGGSGEHAFSFTAPSDGEYRFDTQDSSFDTVLYLLDQSCQELGCNDDQGGGVVQSELVASLAANQTVIVVVDGYAGDQGPYWLSVATLDAPSCGAIAMDLGSAVPQTVNGSTVGLGDDFDPPCEATGPDVAFAFTAPANGSYQFDTFGSSFDTVLAVYESGCSSLLDCDDDTGGLQSSVTVDLTAGQSVVVVVDGFGVSQGNFVLHVNN